MPWLMAVAGTRWLAYPTAVFGHDRLLAPGNPDPESSMTEDLSWATMDWDDRDGGSSPMCLPIRVATRLRDDCTR